MFKENSLFDLDAINFSFRESKDASYLNLVLDTLKKMQRRELSSLDLLWKLDQLAEDQYLYLENGRFLLVEHYYQLAQSYLNHLRHLRPVPCQNLSDLHGHLITSEHGQIETLRLICHYYNKAYKCLEENDVARKEYLKKQIMLRGNSIVEYSNAAAEFYQRQENRQKELYYLKLSLIVLEQLYKNVPSYQVEEEKCRIQELFDLVDRIRNLYLDLYRSEEKNCYLIKAGEYQKKYEELLEKQQQANVSSTAHTRKRFMNRGMPDRKKMCLCWTSPQGKNMNASKQHSFMLLQIEEELKVYLGSALKKQVERISKLHLENKDDISEETRQFESTLQFILLYYFAKSYWSQSPFSADTGTKEFFAKTLLVISNAIEFYVANQYHFVPSYNCSSYYRDLGDKQAILTKSAESAHRGLQKTSTQTLKM